MLYLAPMAGRDVAIWGRILGLAANPQGTVPSAPGVATDTPPHVGCCRAPRGAAG